MSGGEGVQQGMGEATAEAVRVPDTAQRLYAGRPFSRACVLGRSGLIPHDPAVAGQHVLVEDGCKAADPW